MTIKLTVTAVVIAANSSTGKNTTHVRIYFSVYVKITVMLSLFRSCHLSTFSLMHLFRENMRAINFFPYWFAEDGNGNNWLVFWVECASGHHHDIFCMFCLVQVLREKNLVLFLYIIPGFWSAQTVRSTMMKYKKLMYSNATLTCQSLMYSQNKLVEQGCLGFVSQVGFFHIKSNICIDSTLLFCPAVENW